MITVRDQLLIDVLSLAVVMPEDEIAQVEAMTGQKYDHQAVAARLFLSDGPKWTAADEEGPLVAAGYMYQRPGVFRSWYLPHPRVWADKDGLARPLTRITRNIIRDTLTTGIAHRLEVVVLSSRNDAQSWYPMIGLKYESSLPCYGAKGEDFAMYVALREDCDGQ